jgi:hypothetical protein
MSWKKIANPKLNRVRASYTGSDKPSAICLIQIIPKTKKQPSNTKKRSVVAVSADPSFGDELFRSGFMVLVFDNILPRMFSSLATFGHKEDL